MIKPPECIGCPLERIGSSFSEPEGLGKSGVWLIGEGLGREEALDGKPFRPKAASGSKLEEVFRLLKRELLEPVERDYFGLWNVVACQPPGNKLAEQKYEIGAVDHCKVHYDRVVNEFGANRIKVFVALGNVAMKALTDFNGKAKEKQSVSLLRGYVLKNRRGGLVIPSLHPSHVKRGKGELTPLLVADIRKALEVARGQFVHPFSRQYVPPVYQTSPSIDEAWSFYYRVRDNVRLTLTYDIETEDSASVEEDERDELESTEIVQIQFSLGKGTGIAFPWNSTYLPVITKILGLPNVKANHNTWNFDNPRIKAKGVKIEGKVHDTQWMFKHWHPKLPRGLQNVASLMGFPFPWKHIYGADLPWYGCADVDAVHWILESLPGMMQERGIWGGYVRHVYRINTIMRRASDSGIPVSEVDRLAVEADFKKRRAEEDDRIQEEIPDEIRNIKPKRKLKDGGFDYGYVKLPAVVKKEYTRFTELCTLFESKHGRPTTTTYPDYLYKKYGIAVCNFRAPTGEIVQRWAKLERFKASSQQVIRYLRWKQKKVKEEGNSKLAKEYEVPLNLKTKRETTNADDLEEMYLKTGDKVLESIIRIRSYDTNINNYLKNWKPGRDGCVHTTFGYAAPTGQFDSRRPNVLNCSKHTDFGKEFRRIIVAPPGYTFIEFDKKSFHVGTMGYCANDRDYIRFSQIDPHSIFTTYISPDTFGGSIPLSWSDKDIKAKCKEVKALCKKMGEDTHGVDIRQALAKPTVLGNQLGLGPKKLYWQNRRFIDSEDRARELQSILAYLFGKVEAFKTNVKQEAHLQKVFINEFARIQYFYDVFAFSFNKKTGQWERKEGQGAREPVAFRVQSTAFGMLHEEMLTMEELGYMEEYNFKVSIHDSLVFMPEIGKRDRCIENIYRIMNSPCKQLVNEATGPEGLLIGVEVAVGDRWSTMKEIQI